MNSIRSARSRASGTLALVISLVASSAAIGQTTSTTGRLLASNCFQCHGTNGKGPGFDRIAGKSADEIYGDLVEFRGGHEGKGIMSAHALGYTDTQLRQLADWLSRQR